MKFEQLHKDEIQPSLAHLTKLTAVQPPIVAAHVAAAKYAEAAGDYKQAAALYEAAIDHVPVAQKSATVRVYEGLKRVYGASGEEVEKERKITIDEKDTELDIVAAHLGLANIQYWHVAKHKDAVKNWAIAAFEYHDPAAYWELAAHCRRMVKGALKTGDLEVQAGRPVNLVDDYGMRAHNDHHPIDNYWMASAPYSWYEYTMKAAVSGHAEACYSIGILYLLNLIYPEVYIVDPKMRRLLLDSPFTKEMADQVDTAGRWLVCAGKAGWNPGYLVRAWLRCSYSDSTTLEREANENEHLEGLRRVRDGEAIVGMGVGDVEWMEGERVLAGKLVEDIMRREAAGTVWMGPEEKTAAPLGVKA